MAGYLITWNPLKYKWGTLEDNITEFKERGRLTACWSCGVTKKIRSGDRIFMLRQGVEPRGIMASGWAVSDVFEDEHWGFEGKSANYIYVMFDSILNPDIDKILKRELLDKSILGKMHWNTQSSGISIDADIIAELEKIWLEFSNSMYVNEGYDIEFNEGSKFKVNTVRHERNRAARIICIEKYGCKCMACGMDFESMYGEIGKGFIHVHHLNPVAESYGQYTLNPLKDLRPLCPNCHVMIHKRKPIFTIDELKKIIDNNAT